MHWLLRVVALLSALCRFARAQPGTDNLLFKAEIDDLNRNDLASPHWQFTPKANQSFHGQIGFTSDYLYYTFENSRLIFGVKLKDQKLDFLYDQISQKFRDASRVGQLLSEYYVESRRPLEIQVNQGVVLFHDPDLFRITALSTESDEYLYTLPLPKGRLGKALVDINNVAYVLVEEPAASGPFSEVGLVALEVTEGTQMWHFGGDLTGLKSDSLEVVLPRDCVPIDTEPLLRELEDLKSTGKQECGPDDEDCLATQQSLKRRKRELNSILNEQQLLSSSIKQQEKCEEIESDLKKEAKKIASGEIKDKSLQIKNEFGCRQGCNVAEYIHKFTRIYVNLNNTAYFIDTKGLVQERFAPTDVDNDCREVNSQLWYSTNTYVFCYSAIKDGIRFVDFQSGKLKAPRNTGALAQITDDQAAEVIAADDRLYYIQRAEGRGADNAVGIDIESGEVAWDFECSFVQEQTAALGTCDVLFMCADPKVSQLVVGCGNCSNREGTGFTVVLDRESGRKVYGAFIYNEDYTKEHRCFVQSNPYETSFDGNAATTLYYRQGEKPAEANIIDDPSGGISLFTFTLIGTTVELDDDADYEDQIVGNFGPQGAIIVEEGEDGEEEDGPEGRSQTLDYNQDGIIDIYDEAQRELRKQNQEEAESAEQAGSSSQAEFGVEEDTSGYQAIYSGITVLVAGLVARLVV